MSALRVKCRTIMILVKLVRQIIRTGARAINVSVINILSGPLSVPLPLS